ncbi:MAG: OsmC family peroxiredoxin [Actinomycetes bacterium]
MAIVRKAEVEWIGGLIDGDGTIVSTSTGALPQLGVSWAGRIDEVEDTNITSPEELIAAAHASCFAMQFTSGLVGSGWEPEEMNVSAEVSFETGLGITRSHLTARVTVDGLSDEKIREIAERAKLSCPVSLALAGVEITLDLPDLAPPPEETPGEGDDAAEE